MIQHRISLILAIWLTALGVNLHAQTFGSLDAVDDYATTGPLKTVKVNVIANDTLPCGTNYTWRIITGPTTAQGTAVKEGEHIIFTPSETCRNTTVSIKYGLTCSGVEVEAFAHIFVSQYNMPANLIPSTTECVDIMTAAVSFEPHKKFNTSTSIRLDGFSMPLVGDLNGDGKPEIVALGLGRTGSWTNGDGLYARAWYIHIFDGQTGARIWSVNMGTEPGSGGVGGNVTSLGHSGITTDMSETNDQFQLRDDPYHNSPGHLAIADLDRDGKAEIVVAEIGNQGRIYALTPTLNAQGKIAGFTKIWTGSNYKSPVSGNHEHYGAGIPYIADINADGKPEVLIYNKIYDGKTGTLVCTLERLAEFTQADVINNVTNIRNNYAYVGRQPLQPHTDNYSPCMRIVDIDGDGKLDIVAGSKVYRMKEENGTWGYDIIHGPSQVAVNTGTGSSKITVYLADGFTTVGDIDMDGKLDVIVYNMVAVGGDNHHYIMYVWDPMNNPTQAKAAMLLYEDGWEGYISYPFMGDINGRNDSYDGTKRMPELCFVTGRLQTNGENTSTRVKRHPGSSNGLTMNSSGDVSNSRFNTNADYGTTNGFVLGWTWHANPDGSTPIEQRLKLSWALEIVDRSQMTGITMFDFDNDGIMDICYKDERALRVISPSLRDYVPYSTTGGAVRFNQTDIYSYTAYEAPVIADINMDGSADILTMNYGSSGFHSYSYIYAWEHKPGTAKWAPCPPVWNQTIYDPLLINEDLTVPAKPHSMLESYKKNGVDIYPYNAQWVQQPIVMEGASGGYVPAVRKPDAELYNMSVTVGTSSTAATLYIRNRGSATINASTPIAFYNGQGNPGYPIGHANTTLITTVTAGVDIFPGESVELAYTLSGNFNDKLIWARIMDSGTSFPASGYTDCDLSNNAFSASSCPNLNYTITAIDDVICAQTNGTATPLTLTATRVPQVTPAYTPTFQWYRNGTKIPGATSETYDAILEGSYTCYVTEGICRMFTSAKQILKRFKEARDDRALAVVSMPVDIPVALNDYIPKSCPPAVAVTVQPKHGTASASGSLVHYIPQAGYIGPDTLVYSLDGSGSEAKVCIVVRELPGDISEADCYITPGSASWTFLQAAASTNAVHNYISPLTGDIDGDGIVEIIAANPTLDSIYIYKGNNLSSPQKMAIAKINGKAGVPYSIAMWQDTTYLVVAGENRQLHTYSLKDRSFKRTSPGYYHTGISAASAGFADFNADGKPEIYAGGSIYDLTTGGLIAASPGNCGYTAQDGGGVLRPAVADVDGDGLLEYVAGNEVYSVDVDGKSMTLKYKLAGASSADTPGGAVTYKDGQTQAVDWDRDGLLDIVVSYTDNTGKFFIYVWAPSSGGGGTEKAHYASSAVNGTTNSAIGMPALGDIDGDKYPEIVFTSQSRLNILKADNAKAGKVDYSHVSTTDASGFTGLTLFDFNQDSISEIVYRDNEALRIINAGKKSHITGNDTIIYNLQSTPLYSGTSGEYPVVADVNSDGAAEIVVVGSGSSSATTGGTLRIYKSSVGKPWAPARKVWNQHAYSPAYVDDDLAIPPYPLNPATRFPGANGIWGDADDVQPYNHALQQQTSLSKDGTLLWAVPRAKHAVEPVYDYYPYEDSLRVTVKVTNTGWAAFGSPFYITVYKDSASPAQVLKIDSIQTTINPGDTVTATIILKNLSTFLPFNKVVVRLNSKGQADYLQPQCDYGGNEKSMEKEKIFRVNGDTQTGQEYQAIDIAILSNDSLPSGFASGNFSLLDSVRVLPEAGTLMPVGSGNTSRLIYMSNGAARLTHNVDSFKYEFTFRDPSTSIYKKWFAWVYIYILQDKNGASVCLNNSYTVNFAPKPTNVEFNWFDLAGTPVGNGETRTLLAVKADSSYLVQPVIADATASYNKLGGFPQGLFTVFPANKSAATATMRWTGLESSDWYDPKNWVEVRTENGKDYDTPVFWAPVGCVNVLLPANVDNYPELTDSVYCNDILIKDRAMLKNPHVLVYKNASVEFKLKPTERDRFVMWSAPLKNMYSGDYHYRVNNAPYWGDTYINYFQHTNPDPQVTGAQATANHFTATVGSVTQKLDLGTAFNLKVTTTSITRDSFLRFPRTESAYIYNGNTVTMARGAESKFITDGKSGIFDLPVSGADLSGVSLVQVVNPYLAYLDFSKFAASTANNLSGYYTWSGDPDDGFAAIVSLNNGNRIETTTPSSHSPFPTIQPLQSFFIQATSAIQANRTVKMSSDWTTTSPSSPYSLRASEMVSSGGVLHITLSQGAKKAYAALLYTPGASNFMDPEDMPPIIYKELPLAVYTFSTNQALAINSSSTFDMFPVPLGFRATTAGETKLEFKNRETFGYDVTLIDKALNKRIDLNVTPEYTFTVTKAGATSAEINDRFSLEMKYTGNGVTITGNEIAQPSALQVSGDAGYIHIKSETGVIGSLQIYDAAGKLLYSTANLNESQFKLPVNGKQMYVVKATVGDIPIVEKVMLK